MMPVCFTIRLSLRQGKVQFAVTLALGFDVYPYGERYSADTAIPKTLGPSHIHRHKQQPEARPVLLAVSNLAPVDYRCLTKHILAPKPLFE